MLFNTILRWIRNLWKPQSGFAEIIRQKGIMCSLIEQVLSENGPMMAKDLAKVLAQKHDVNVTKKDVNSVLYRFKDVKFSKNNKHRWSIIKNKSKNKVMLANSTR